ncbi:MAG: hypothetical protein DBY11_03465 [Eggerthellales bacterium]|nr:MAG: hypothetical protein DBY11_03465 [Eggerthellales bacterium]
MLVRSPRTPHNILRFLGNTGANAIELWSSCKDSVKIARNSRAQNVKKKRLFLRHQRKTRRLYYAGVALIANRIV